MTILIDTPIWSLAYRRKRLSPEEQAIVDELGNCIERNRAVLVGPIRQEVLSGISSPAQTELLRVTMRAFEDLPLEISDFECAAEMNNKCRGGGVQGSHIDFMLCAVSHRYDAPIFTTDQDFSNIAQHIDIKLHPPGVT